MILWKPFFRRWIFISHAWYLEHFPGPDARIAHIVPKSTNRKHGMHEGPKIVGTCPEAMIWTRVSNIFRPPRNHYTHNPAQWVFVVVCLWYLYYPYKTRSALPDMGLYAHKPIFFLQILWLNHLKLGVEFRNVHADPKTSSNRREKYRDGVY